MRLNLTSPLPRQGAQATLMTGAKAQNAVSARAQKRQRLSLLVTELNVRLPTPSASRTVTTRRKKNQRATASADLHAMRHAILELFAARVGLQLDRFLRRRLPRWCFPRKQQWR